MFYLHNGKLYAPRASGNATVWDLMCVRASEDGTLCIMQTGRSAHALPSGATPMTHAEVYARIPPEKPKKPKGGGADVS